MLSLYGKTVRSRLLIGSALYPSPAIMRDAIKASNSQIVTVSLRRESAAGKGEAFWSMIADLPVSVLPNTAGCHTVKEAVATAHMARDLFKSDWIKLEVIGDHETLQPDPFGLVEAACILCADGFSVFPYMTDDLVLAERLLEAGCQVLMPWCAPIGSAAGPLNPHALKTLRARFPDIPLIVDAGLGRPSHASQVMEMGYDAVLLNTAVAKAADPVAMARAFAKAVDAGHMAYNAGMLEPRAFASPSTPLIGQAVFS